MSAARYLLLSLLIPLAASAQTGVVTGTVRDGTGLPLPGVNVLIVGTERGAATDAEGTYRIEALAPGPYRLRASLVGYTTQTQDVQVEGIVRVDFVLEEQVVEGGEVFITASRRAQEAQNVPVSVSVVTPRDIETRGIVTLDAALRNVPGVQLADNQVSVRGSSGFSYNVGSRVLLLVDGVPLLGPDSDGIPFESLPMQMVERIEVVKGPGSALYGGGALGGVVGLITKDFPARPETAFRASIAAHQPVRHASWRAKWSEGDAWRPYGDIGVSHARRLGERAGFWLSLSYRADAGHLRLDREERLLVYGKLGLQPSASTRLDVLGGVTRNEGDAFLYWNGLDDPLNPGSLALGGGNTTGSNDNLTLRASFLPSFTHTLRPNLFYIARARVFGIQIRPLDENLRPRPLIRGTVGVRYGGEVQVVWQAPRGFLTTGATVDANAARSNYFGPDPPFYTQPEGAVYAQWEHEPLGPLHLTGGLRYDFYRIRADQTEQRLSPKLNLLYRLAENLSLRASYGEGFRVPGVAERYVNDASLFPIVSNPGLRPETSRGYEVGARGSLATGIGRFDLDAALFWTDYRRLVETKFVTTPQQGFQFVNLTRARVRGAETSLSWAPSTRLDARASYQLLDARDLTEDAPLVFRSRHLVQSSLSVRPLRPVEIGVDYRFSSRPGRVDSDFARFVPDAQSLVDAHVLDARVAYRWSWFEVSFLVRNALDHHYAERPAILAPPRSFGVQVMGRF